MHAIIDTALVAVSLDAQLYINSFDSIHLTFESPDINIGVEEGRDRIFRNSNNGGGTNEHSNLAFRKSIRIK